MKIVLGPADNSQEEQDEPKKYDKYEVEDAANTLERAEGIKSNPHLMKHVKKHAAEKAKNYGKISSISDLKSKYKELMADEQKEGE